MKKTTKCLVVFTEYERGWGNKDFMVVEHDDIEVAKRSVLEENSKNNLPYVPDYYIVARLVSDPSQFKYYEKLI
jgi:hypothetical protein